MSFMALQRVAVRMLMDPSFADAVFESPATALAEVDLSDDELHWLQSTDRRAWQLDPMRRTRTLQALMEEFPVSSALILQQRGSADVLDAFFSSPYLHDAIQTRAYLTEAYDRYLGTLAVPDIGNHLRIEAALARCRGQEPPVHLKDGDIHIASHHALLILPGGSTERYLEHLNYLQRAAQKHQGSVLAAMLTQGFRFPKTRALQTSQSTYLLVEPSPQGPALGEVSESLGLLLAAASKPISREALAKRALSLGAEEHEAEELLNELIHDGLLRTGPL